MNRTKTAQGLPTALLVAIGIAQCLMTPLCLAQDEVVDMVVELLKGADPDMRVLALQQIREELPGEAATKRFVEVLPTLSTDLQVQLIDALGERGDAAARPAILKMLNSDSEPIRDVAARALAGVASPDDIPVLANMAGTGSGPEKTGARRSLRLLRGNKMNTAMTEALKQAPATSRVELISALIDRNVKESAKTVFALANDPNLAVRMAVLDAFAAMADANDTPMVVQRLTSAKDRMEIRKATQALQATCRRARAKSAQAVIAGFQGADPTTRIYLMRALAEARGPKSLNEILARMKDQDKRVQSEAVRILTSWPDRAAAPALEKLALDVKTPRNHVLAIRGLVRLAGPSKKRAADLNAMKHAMKLATRNEEMVLIMGALGTIPTVDSLAMVSPFLDEPALVENAGLAAVLIAEKIGQDKKAQVKAVMQKVLSAVKNDKTRSRAQAVLNPPATAAPIKN